MNDKTNKTGFAGYPCIRFYHPNAKNTGTAMFLSMLPASGTDSGFITFSVFPQKNTAFDYDNPISGVFSPIDAAALLEVFRGCRESVYDGKGISFKGETETVTVKVSHRIEPKAGYLFEFTSKPHDPENGKDRNLCFFLSTVEALGLSLAIEQSMKDMMFGESITLYEARALYFGLLAASKVSAEKEGEEESTETSDDAHAESAHTGGTDSNGSDNSLNYIDLIGKNLTFPQVMDALDKLVARYGEEHYRTIISAVCRAVNEPLSVTNEEFSYGVSALGESHPLIAYVKAEKSK